MTNKGPRGKRHKSRYKLRNREGKPSVNTQIKQFEDGEIVHIKINSSIHAGIPAHKFQGHTGRVMGVEGKPSNKRRFYRVKVRHGTMTKELVVHPAHLDKAISQGVKE